MKRCDICKYQKDCPDIVDIDSIWCITHRRIPKNFDNEYIEKQQLISFIRDKIQENVDKNKKTNYDLDILYTGKIVSLQEVLDFVNKGGKE